MSERLLGLVAVLVVVGGTLFVLSMSDRIASTMRTVQQRHHANIINREWRLICEYLSATVDGSTYEGLAYQRVMVEQMCLPPDPKEVHHFALALAYRDALARVNAEIVSSNPNYL